MAVVFYAGHGMEMNGVNYLIPVDATLARDVDVEDETVSVERVIRTIEPVRRLQLVILDACRDNPFVRSMRRTFVSRSLRSGHGDIDERALPPNTLIAYAQKAGLTAEDGDGADSPYTTALLKHLATPGLDIELALRRVRDEVLNATRNRQEPFKYGSLGGAELPLVPSAAARPTAPPPSTAPVTPQRWSEAAEAWDRTKDSTSIPALEAFMARFTGTYYADLARLRIEDLRKQSEAQTIAPPSNGPASQSTELVHSAADTLERVMPAVVAVQLKKPGNATDTGAALSRVPKDALFEDAFFEEFFNGKGTRAADAKDEVAHVSGFFISDEGLIVTRLPAIEPTQEISVIDDHGANYKAKLVGRHVETNIALLKIDSSRKFPRVAFSNRSVTIGEYLLKASNPFGLVGSASVTKVSGWQSFSELPQSIELNTPINKGEAGAAIFDLDGEVVGVGMGSRSDEKGTDHAGYALPANVVNYVVDQLRRTGAVLDRSGLANEFNRTRGISSTPANRLLIGVPSASVNNAQAGIVFISMGSGSERNTSVLGSGFVIDGKDGIIVTNNHVIEGADEIIVNFSDGNKLKVDKVLGKDTMTDLAVLKVTPKKPLASLPFGSSAKIRVGDWVMAIPFSRCARSWPCSSVTVGIISAKQRNINSGPYDDYLQNDVAINKGKRGSGSPLFNMDGEVIGVNTAILSPTTGFIGIGVAKPSDTAVVVIDQLRQYGEVRRGWLGVSDPDAERGHRRCAGREGE